MATGNPQPKRSASGFESDADSLAAQFFSRKVHLIESIRQGLTVLALCCGITALALASHTLSVYRWTHLPDEYLLPLWPDSFDIRPTVALIAGSSIVVVASIISLVASRVTWMRSKMLIHTSTSFSAPVIGLIAAIVAMSVFYAVNTSTTADTMQSWTCRWKAVAMMWPPHFSTLCNESQAGLYMAILLIPLEVLIVGMAAWQFVVERQASKHGFSAVKPKRPGSQ